MWGPGEVDGGALLPWSQRLSELRNAWEPLAVACHGLGLQRPLGWSVWDGRVAGCRRFVGCGNREGKTKKMQAWGWRRRWYFSFLLICCFSRFGFGDSLCLTIVWDCFHGPCCGTFVLPTKLCDTQGKPGLAVGCLSILARSPKKSDSPTAKAFVQPSESA